MRSVKQKKIRINIFYPMSTSCYDYDLYNLNPVARFERRRYNGDKGLI